MVVFSQQHGSIQKCSPHVTANCQRRYDWFGAASLMWTKNYFTKQHCKHHMQQDWDKFKALRNEVNQRMWKGKIEHFRSICKNRSHQPRSTWMQLNSALGKKKSNQLGRQGLNSKCSLALWSSHIQPVWIAMYNLLAPPSHSLPFQRRIAWRSCLHWMSKKLLGQTTYCIWLPPLQCCPYYIFQSGWPERWSMPVHH